MNDILNDQTTQESSLEDMRLDWSLFSFQSPQTPLKTLTLNPLLFGTFWSPSVIKIVVQWQLAKRRIACQSTQARADVSGSTRKLHRQKGTGRARVGSANSPTRVGGAVALAPKPRLYGYRINKKERFLGLCMALSSKVSDHGLFLVDHLMLSDCKTAHLQKTLHALGTQKKTLLVGTQEEWIHLKQASRNLPNTLVLPTIGLNVYDILRHQSLVLSEKAMRELEARSHD